jgi:AraC-like DNA-binding protein
MRNDIFRENTPLTKGDCFMVFSREKQYFNFPEHFHAEFELNLILDAKDAQRVVGNHVGKIKNAELVLVGPNLPHAWFTGECSSKKITEITIQFHQNLFEESFLNRNQLQNIKMMLDRSSYGLLFSQKAINDIKQRIIDLSKKNGFDSVLELMSILYNLSVAENTVTLADYQYHQKRINYKSRRIQKAFDYMNEHYKQPVFLADVAAAANMAEVSFSRFMKMRTGTTFTDSLNEIRVGHASRMLIDTTSSISEIAFECGFSNIANFNRTFKRRKNCTPKEFRENASGKRIFI